MSRKFQVTAERGNGVWVLESDLGAVSQVRRLDQAADEMREALAYLAGLPEEEVEVEVVPVLPTAYIEAARRSEELRAAAAAAQQEAAASAREAARALLAAPDILLMDEPFASLDVARRRKAMGLVEMTRDLFGIPIVLVSHQIEEVMRLAGQVVMIERGKVREVGPPEAIFASARSASLMPSLTPTSGGRALSARAASLSL